MTGNSGSISGPEVAFWELSFPRLRAPPKLPRTPFLDNFRVAASLDRKRRGADFWGGAEILDPRRFR